MNSQNLVQLLLSFLGGGLISAIIGAIRANKADGIQRKVNRLNTQIDYFYGPLCILVLQNERLFDLYRRIHEAYKDEYIGKNWSSEELTRKRLKEATTITLDIANNYIKEVESNNNKIFELIKASYSYADTEDTKMILDFYEDYIRLNTERAEEGKETLPFEIYQQVGEISFMRPEFISYVKDKTQAKKDQIKYLIK